MRKIANLCGRFWGGERVTRRLASLANEEKWALSRTDSCISVSPLAPTYRQSWWPSRYSPTIGSPPPRSYSVRTTDAAHRPCRPPSLAGMAAPSVQAWAASASSMPPLSNERITSTTCRSITYERATASGRCAKSMVCVESNTYQQQQQQQQKLSIFSKAHYLTTQF